MRFTTPLVLWGYALGPIGASVLDKVRPEEKVKVKVTSGELMYVIVQHLSQAMKTELSLYFSFQDGSCSLSWVFSVQFLLPIETVDPMCMSIQNTVSINNAFTTVM